MNFVANKEYLLRLKIRTDGNNPKNFVVHAYNYSDLTFNSNNFSVYERDYGPFLAISNKEELISYSGSNLTSSFTYYEFCLQPTSNYDHISISPEPEVGNDDRWWIAIDDVSLKEFESLDAGPDADISDCGLPTQIGPSCLYEGATYQWTPSTGLSDPNIANPIAGPSSTTNYQLVVSYPSTSCSISDNVTVTNSNGSTVDYIIPDGADIDWLLNNVPASVNNNVFINYNFYIEGTFYIDKQINNQFGNPENVAFNSCYFLFSSGGKIVISDNAGMDTPTGSTFETCDDSEFWNGIIIEGNSGGNAQISQSTIKNSTHGIVLNDGAQCFINNCQFDRNKTSITINANGSNKKLVSLSGNSFSCSSPLNNGSAFYPQYAIKIYDWKGNGTYPRINLGASTIDGKAGGIRIENSDVKVNNSTFSSFNNQYNPFGPDIQETVITLFGDDNATNVPEVMIEDNYFINSKEGIDSRQAHVLTVDGNTVNKNSSGTYFGGIDLANFISMSDNDESITFTNNEIYNIQTGVAGFNVPVVTIASNTFDMETQSSSSYTYKNNDRSTGIVINNYNDNTNSGAIDINNNTISHAKMGIDVGFAHASITDNEVYDLNDQYQSPSGCSPYPSPCPPLQAYGIRVANTDNGYTLERNKIQLDLNNYSSAPDGDTKVIGISLENSANANGNESVLHCNSVQHTGVGLKFSGSNEAATEVEKNLMKENYYGFVLANNGFIGDVGSDGTAADNEWEGTFGFSDTYADNSNGGNCKLYVRNSSPFNPSIDVNFDQNNGIALTKDNTGNSASSTACTVHRRLKSGSTPATISQVKGNTAGQLIKGKPAYMVNASDSALRLSRQLLYWQLSKDSVLSNDSIWKPFADSMKNTALGKVLGKNGLSFSSTGLDHFDQDLITIEAIQTKMDNNQTLSSADSTDLYQMAALCPYYNGIAVYLARGILRQMGIMVGVNDCEISPRTTAPSKKIKSFNGSEHEAGLRVYPNPTREEVNVQYPVAKDEIIIFELLDVLGKKLYTETLSEGNLHDIELSQRQQGIYIYRLTQNNTVINSGKLVIE